MASLFCSEEEFRADVEAMQAAYEQRCKDGKATFNANKRCLPTAGAAGAYGDWAWDPQGQRKLAKASR